MFKKILIIIILVIVAVAGFFLATVKPVKKEVVPPENVAKESPKIISTKPDPLDNGVIAANEIIEVTFNRSLENVGEFKSRIESGVDYKVELSGDRKTAKIIPAKPYQLGTTYTLFIGTETKFDGVGRWGEEKVFHFRTIKYTGV